MSDIHKNDSKILVVGSTGYIGSHLVDKLIKTNYEVYGLVRGESNKHQNYPYEIIHADLTKPEQLKNISKQYFDVVIHLASYTPLEKNKKKQYLLNFKGIQNLFEQIKENIKSFVYISGLGVFDQHQGIVDEKTPLLGDTFFGKTRIDAQNFLDKSCSDHNIDFSTIYPAEIVYGLGGQFDSLIISKLQNGKFRMPGSGSYYKNYVHIDDFVNSITTIIQKKQIGKSFIVTDSNPAPFNEFVNFIADTLQVKRPKTVPASLAKIVMDKEFIDLISRSVKASNDKIKNYYDFQFPSYKTGIVDILENNTYSAD